VEQLLRDEAAGVRRKCLEEMQVTVVKLPQSANPVGKPRAMTMFMVQGPEHLEVSVTA
jgi:hypothetical protein